MEFVTLFLSRDCDKTFLTDQQKIDLNIFAASVNEKIVIVIFILLCHFKTFF